MSSKRFFMLFLVAWPALVFTVLTSRIAMSGTGLALSEYAGWGFLACAPVAMYLMLMRSRPERSIAKVIYDAERGN
jgi:hypothetical protein